MSMFVWKQFEKEILLSPKDDSVDPKNKSIINYLHRLVFVDGKQRFISQIDRDFQEPYQCAVKYCGGTWEDYNNGIEIKIPFCNMNCVYCDYISIKREKSSFAFIGLKNIIRELCRKSRRGVLKVSGGEPFLIPDFVVEICNQVNLESFKLERNKQYYIIFETNLLAKEYELTVKKIDRITPYCIVGSFKGFNSSNFSQNTGISKKITSEEYFDVQFKNGAKILEKMLTSGLGEIFFTVPELLWNISNDEAYEILSSFIDKLSSEIHRLAPLRVTILNIRDNGNIPSGNERFESGRTKKMYFTLIKERYGDSLAWLPQHQICLKGKKT